VWTVLIVDDYPVAREIFQQFFTSFPQLFYVAGQAGNGEEAVKLAMEKKPDFILMDITMPLLDGLAATKIMKKELGLASLIITYSGYPFAALKERAMVAGARDHFSKPLDLMVLKEKMVNEYSRDLRQDFKKVI